MRKKKKNNYFVMLLNMAGYCSKAAVCLEETLQNYNQKTLQHKIEEIHQIEHSADEAKHDLTNRLLTEFITPINREDILHLSDCIDDVTDHIEDVLLNLYMYHIDELVPQLTEFSHLLQRSCKQLEKVMEEFSKLQKSPSIKSLLIQVDSLESEGDVLYADTIRSLYQHTDWHPLKVMAWEKILSCFEKCYDSCEGIANCVQNILITNS